MNLITRCKPISIALALSILAGCASAPGPYLNKDRLADDMDRQASDRVYPVHLITPDVVRTQNAALAADAARIDGLPGTGAPSIAAADYRVQPPDVLSVTVYGHPELAAPTVPTLPAVDGSTPPAVLAAEAGPVSQGLRVGSDGCIFFPTLGRVPVAGKTVEQIAAQLTQALARNRRQPQVDVTVVRYLSQQVQIAGELKAPGTFAITDAPLTLVNAIARAGGALPNADLHRVRLTRDGRTTVLDADAVYDRGDVAQNIVLRGGDILNVPDRGDSRVFVIGEAMKPSALPMSKWRMTLADALTSVGSIDAKYADPRQIYVVRGTAATPTEPSVYRLDMTQVDSILLATQFPLQALDVVYIGTASSARFNRVLEQVLPTLQALFYTVQLTR
ncbi:polysaccharide biosynthesis/export family protein [Chitinasiproducens palmae]|uniref:Polysaccharide export outer membrane protein n=1 Tax=Chitinasiproducens palmae TaxID=1770053 RepID=A0A1H2PUN9_9BURK|nr:polysaccharide biosynthesis/export family protein [Chitinasiproducens palmae]SDV50554.1 polysaccharide export outer membrane protein [Chitinasiproducens palmae]